MQKTESGGPKDLNKPMSNVRSDSTKYQFSQKKRILQRKGGMMIGDRNKTLPGPMHSDKNDETDFSPGARYCASPFLSPTLGSLPHQIGITPSKSWLQRPRTGGPFSRDFYHPSIAGRHGPPDVRTTLNYLCVFQLYLKRHERLNIAAKDIEGW